MTKILVTGAAGYIGSMLVPTLLRNNYKVIALDNFRYRQKTFLDCLGPHVTIVKGDACDEALLKRYMHNVRFIIPLACLTGAPICERCPNEARRVNYEALRTLLKLRSKEQGVIFPTTNSGYGIGQQNIHCTEESPLNPISLYGRLKVDAEKAVLDSGSTISLRLATVFGMSPRMRLDLLVNDFTFSAFHNHFLELYEGHFKRNFVHIHDIVRAFMHCIVNYSRMCNEVYNVGLDSANVSKKELCQEIQKQIPEFVFKEIDNKKDPDQRNYIVSNAKIHKQGFRAKTTLQQGIAELIQGYTILGKVKRSDYANYP